MVVFRFIILLISTSTPLLAFPSVYSVRSEIVTSAVLTAPLLIK